MIAATLDTNLLASGMVATGGTIRTLLYAWIVERRDNVALSSSILEELERTLRKPYFIRRSSTHDLLAYQRAVRQTARIVTIVTPVPTVLRTRPDNLVLATAESAGVPYVVSGDRELQALGQYRAITILSPRQFLDLLEREG